MSRGPEAAVEDWLKHRPTLDSLALPPEKYWEREIEIANIALTEFLEFTESQLGSEESRMELGDVLFSIMALGNVRKARVTLHNTQKSISDTKNHTYPFKELKDNLGGLLSACQSRDVATSVSKATNAISAIISSGH